MKEIKKRISRLAVVGAFIMALSCTMKITAYYLDAPLISQWINVVMNFVIVYGCFELGRMAGLGRTHRFLCYTAVLGYIFYGVILLFFREMDNGGLSASVLCFFMLTLAMSVWLFIDLVRQDLKQTEKDLKILEKEMHADEKD